jgi:hypothetical protein
MSINSRLRKVRKSLQQSEVALLWLKTLQAKGGFADWWKFSEFVPWASESELAGLRYNLVFEINSAVFIAADRWHEFMSGARMLALVVLGIARGPEPLKLGVVEGFEELWRQKLCTFLADVIALAQAIELISERHFDGHDILFIDTKEKLASSYVSAKLLVSGYNIFAEENGKEAIDIDVIKPSPGSIEKMLNRWVIPCRATALAACGRDFDARDLLLSWFSANEPVDRPSSLEPEPLNVPISSFGPFER